MGNSNKRVPLCGVTGNGDSEVLVRGEIILVVHWLKRTSVEDSPEEVAGGLIPSRDTNRDTELSRG